MKLWVKNSILIVLMILITIASILELQFIPTAIASVFIGYNFEIPSFNRWVNKNE